VNGISRALLAGAAALIASSGAALADEPVLGLAAIDLQNSFFVRMKEAGDVAAKDYKVKSVWQSAEGSLEKQVAIIENFLNQKVSAILVDPLDKNALVPVIKRAEAAGIPVVTMGNKVEAGQYSTLYPDYVNESTVARALGVKMGGTGQVGLLVGSRGNYVSDTRERAFTDVMRKEFPGIEVVGIEPTNWDAGKATNAAQTWLTTYPDLKAIACISDSLCLAADAVASGMGHDLVYGGYDGDAEVVPLLKSGKMVMDVLTGPYRVGYWNIAVAARLAKGDTLPKDLFLPTYFISSAENAKLLADKGLKVETVDPDKGQVEAKNYQQQLGPSLPDGAMTAGK
jgi:ribose transport system substrate-binding protein